MVESRIQTTLDGDAHVITPPGKTLVLEQPVYDDLRVELSSVRVPAVAGPGFSQFKDNGDSSTGVFLPWFDDGTEEQVYFSAQFPHSQQLNSRVYPHIHWTPAANGGAGQKVNWGLEYTWAEPFAIFGDTTIIYANDHVPDETLVAGKHYISGFEEIEGHTNGVSNIMVCRLFRDAGGTGGTDDLAQDAGALYVDFHFRADTLGSRTEFSK